MYKLFFLNICCLFLLVACDNANSSTIQQPPPQESKATFASQTTDEVVLHFTGPTTHFDEIEFNKTIAPAFISQTNCECNQLATIKAMEYGYDYALSNQEDGYLCDADGDGNQDFLVPIVCRKGDEVSITIAFINDSKDPAVFHIASNKFIEFPDGKGIDCKK